MKPPRVAQSPAAFECRHWKTLEMPRPADGKGEPFIVAFGLVVVNVTISDGANAGIYIDDAFIKDGIVDTPSMKPLARLGYMDYSVLTPETVFSLNRPIATEDGRSAKLVSGPWDGVYR